MDGDAQARARIMEQRRCQPGGTPSSRLTSIVHWKGHGMIWRSGLDSGRAEEARCGCQGMKG